MEVAHIKLTINEKPTAASCMDPDYPEASNSAEDKSEAKDFILAASCMDSDQPEASCSASFAASSSADPEQKSKIIEDVFMDCTNWISTQHKNNLPVDRITTLQFCIYMGDTPKDYEIVKEYLQRHLDQSLEHMYYIDLQAFGELFENHCGYYGLSVEECAVQRKAATVVMIEEEKKKWLAYRKQMYLESKLAD
ncbi:uncharacterized protein LOC126839256 [Adelges cooleyi]|uniref:uncharacterized protein LOC126839256 n=1 Tax=Adelges cooleyi TaxID=133065 RepID=UPI00218018F5|nr:uncharacterized protein LOC126839256 [Adelges cooleyi]